MAKQKHSWVLWGAAILAAAVLLVWLNTRPYTAQGARRLYERHQAAYDTVAEAMLRDGSGPYWLARPEEWPEELAGALNKVLSVGRWWGTGLVECTTLGVHDTPAVLFLLHHGEERDSGDGGMMYDLQYLAYVPKVSDLAFSNQHTEQITPLTDGWYLYTETVF